MTSRRQLDAVAATQGPGLPMALLIGFKAAQSVAFALRKPFMASTITRRICIRRGFAQRLVPMPGAPASRRRGWNSPAKRQRRLIPWPG